MGGPIWPDRAFVSLLQARRIAELQLVTGSRGNQERTARARGILQDVKLQLFVKRAHRVDEIRRPGQFLFLASKIGSHLE
jgi:hypothetical protein